MDLTQHSYELSDTIAAIATPPGEGGIAVIRISGRDSLEVADRVFSGPVHSYASHTAHLGRVTDAEGKVLDSAIVLVMLGDSSFTGENTVEIQGHGGGLVSRRVLERVIQAGARPASPGEFSYRAFINGKLDLAQAEAIQELICAKNERAVEGAGRQLEGKLSEKILDFQQQLTGLAGIVEAWVDFPEEGLEFISEEDLIRELEGLQNQIQALVDTFHDGRIIHEGISLALIGCPNVGKSSLMNALLDRERAIVTHIAGTTRDVVEDALRLNGMNVRLIDTAGIREVTEIVEQEGIRRSRLAMQEADIVLLVLDAHKGLEGEDRALFAEVPMDKTIFVWNKMDLSHEKLPAVEGEHVVHLSAKKKEGLELLKGLIDKLVWKNGPPNSEEVLITSVRHRRALVECVKSLERVRMGLKDKVSPEFLTSDIREALRSLGRIIGVDITEDILSSIFSQFCIGK